MKGRRAVSGAHPPATAGIEPRPVRRGTGGRSKADALDLSVVRVALELDACHGKEDAKNKRDSTCAVNESPVSIQILPDDLLILCLARLEGRSAYCALRSVCRSWRNLCASPLFYQTRTSLGFSSSCFFTLGRPSTQSRGSFLGEIYDPSQNTSHCFPCPWPAVRDRRVLPAGLAIYSCLMVGFHVFLLGGTLNTHIYSPVLNRWHEGAPMLTPRRSFACGCIDGKIIVAGGLSSDNIRLNSAEAYDIHTDLWEPLPPMPETRSGSKVQSKCAYIEGTDSRVWPLAVALVQNCDVKGEAANGRLYIVGDQTSFSPNRKGQPRMLVYDARRRIWTHAASLPDDRCFYQTGVVNGDLFVVGGGRVGPNLMPRAGRPPLHTCWALPLLYNPTADRWRSWQESTAATTPSHPATLGRAHAPSSAATSRSNEPAMVCDSSNCEKLRAKALVGQVLTVAVGSALCTVAMGDQKLNWWDGGVAGGARSCKEVWEEDSWAHVGKKRGRWRRLKHPWYGEVNSISMALKF